MQPNQGATSDDWAQRRGSSQSDDDGTGGRSSSAQGLGNRVGDSGSRDEAPGGSLLVRATLLILLLGIGAAAAILSFSTLRDLALACGYPRELAWLFPITVDAAVAAGTLIWLGRLTNPAATRYARGLTWGALGLTLVMNAAQIGMHAEGITPAWWAAVAIGAIPPAALGAVVHLAVLVGRRPVQETEPVVFEVPEGELEIDGSLTDDQIIGLVKRWDDTPTYESIRLKFGVGTARATRIRQAVMNGHTGGDQQ